MTVDLSPGVQEYLLSLADDEHFVGQHHTEWIGVAPYLEVDLAFSSMGQDELGHAAMLYELVAGVDSGDEQIVDRLAFGRQPGDYRSCHLAERARGDWADAVVRHWLYDSIEQLRWEAVADSSLEPLARIADRALAEEAFHIRHADGLLDALLTDPDAGQRLRQALHDLAPLAVDVFDGVAGEAEAVATGVAAWPLVDRLADWRLTAERRFDVGDFDWTEPSGDGRTVRSADFGPLQARLRQVLDLDPDAVW